MIALYDILARIYWKINRLKFGLNSTQGLNYWRKRKKQILKACKCGYMIDIEYLGLNTIGTSDCNIIGESWNFMKVNTILK